MLSLVPNLSVDKPMLTVYNTAPAEYCLIRSMECIETARVAPSKELADEQLTRAIQLLVFAKQKLG